MSRGFEGIREISKRIEEAENNKINFSNFLYFKLAADESATVRFLEEGDDVVYSTTHKVTRPGRSFPDHIPCRNQNEDGENCPACESDIAKSFRGWVNLIWRGAPKYKKDQEGKFVIENEKKVQTGNEDQVALWPQGITVFRQLAQKDNRFKGLRSRDFEITREGAKYNNTKYYVEPADVDGGPQSLSDEDRKLEQNKYDLNELAKPPTIEQWNAILSNISEPDNEEAEVSEVEVEENIFKKKR